MLQIASKTYGSHPDGPDGDDNQRIETKHPSLDTGYMAMGTDSGLNRFNEPALATPKSGHRTRRAVINQNKRQIYIK